MTVRRAGCAAAAALSALAVALVLLAGGLESVPFRDGQPFDEHVPIVVGTGTRAGASGSMALADLLVAFLPASLLFCALTIYALTKGPRRGGRRRSMAGPLFALAVALLGVAFALQQRAHEPPPPAVADAGTQDSVGSVTAVEELPPASDVVVDTEPAAARSTALVLLGVIAVVAAAAVVALFWGLGRRRRAFVPPDGAAASVREPVEAALTELRAGRSAAGVVERCYRDMMLAYSSAADLNPRALTPREFSRRLASAGFGCAALDDLTLLFERVRYGGRSDAAFADRAASCLLDLERKLATPGTAGS
ncbi:MAG: DUF4129 domain-containing protein [Candidatus Bipolaricaulota bacterium]